MYLASYLSEILDRILQVRVLVPYSVSSYLLVTVIPSSDAESLQRMEDEVCVLDASAKLTDVTSWIVLEPEHFLTV